MCSWDKSPQYGSALGFERMLRFIPMEDSKFQWRPNAKGIPAEPHANFDDKAAANLLPPTVARTPLKS